MVFENGVRAVYEGSSSTAVGLNDWYQEYIRVDCEFGTAILNHREIEVFTRQDLPRQKHREGTGQKVPLLVQPKWINTWLIEKFAQWRDGGPTDGNARCRPTCRPRHWSSDRSSPRAPTPW